jgi:hypothetical protein
MFNFLKQDRALLIEHYQSVIESLKAQLLARDGRPCAGCAIHASYDENWKDEVAYLRNQARFERLEGRNLAYHLLSQQGSSLRKPEPSSDIQFPNPANLTAENIESFANQFFNDNE